MDKIIALGDSVMKGVVFDGETYHTIKESFASMLAAELGLRLLNFAKMGHTIKEGLKVFERMKTRIEPDDLVLLEYGGNDCDFDWPSIGKHPESVHRPKTDIAQFRESYCHLIDMIKARGAKPLLFSLPPLEAAWYYRFFTKPLDRQSTSNILGWLNGVVEHIANWHEQYNLAVFQVAIETSTPIVDISSPLLSRKDYAKYICLDGIHPNQDGHRMIYEFSHRSPTIPPHFSHFDWDLSGT